MELCNLDYVKSISPKNPKFVREMIKIFLKQMPVSVKAMNQCFAESDWEGLQNYAHKIKSQIDCMGIPAEYRDAAKKIEEYAKTQEHLDLIPDLLLKIEKASKQACKELKVELKK
jgi:HPt (histidine-containing phosphotransfer) domain-containing protein